MTDREISEAIKAEFPRHTPGAYSYAKAPAETGVMLTPKARKIVNTLAGHTSFVRDGHSKQYSLRVRVTKERYEAVKRAIQEDGRFPTVNAWLDWWVYVWLKNKEKGGETK